MSTQFYKRYVPPTISTSRSPQSKGSKRKIGELSNSHDEKQPASEETTSPAEAEGQQAVMKKRKKEKKRDKDKVQVEENDAQESEKEGLAATKHAKIRSKFEKSEKVSKLVSRSRKEEKNQEPEDEPKQTPEQAPEHEPELHGLEPIPQPQNEEEEVLPPINTLPDWISKPIRASASHKIAFDELPLHPSIKRALTSKGFKETFAIQSAVLPLLIHGCKDWTRSDVCIASGTGTGKTLAFVLPMIQALRDSAFPMFRGLIVVPTRELVSQTRSLFEACAAGSGLKVAASEGSKTLAEERKMLIQRYARYDPVEAKKRREAKINYFTIGESEDEYFEEDDVNMRLRANRDFVADYASRFDVLVCTPGRLVDHMTSTKGFSLLDVQWFVVDEVDRLLNQSYQEWIRLVIPALEEQELSALEKIFRENRYPVQKRRRVRKIIASATLTTNISKLVSLRLERPTLVTLEGGRNGVTVEGEQSAEQFTLPETLQEIAVPVKDAAEKPLYLLQTIDSLIKDVTAEHGGHARNDSEEELTSSDEATSSDSDSDSTSANSMASISTLSGNSDILSAARSFSDSPARSFKDSQSYPDIPQPIIEGTVVFTRTNEGALRLARLLKLMRPGLASRIGCLAGASRASTRRKTLSQLRKGALSVVIASNLVARGLNIDNLAQVVNYDPPATLESYVHRVGRTARAGNQGTAITLVAHHEARWFWNEIGKSDKVHRTNKVTRGQPADISDEDKDFYSEALSRLGDEARGKV